MGRRGGPFERGLRGAARPWRAVVQLALLVLLLTISTCSVVNASHASESLLAGGWDTMTMEQFEMLDGFFNSTRPAGQRELADMTEDELEAEIKGLMQAFRPPRGAPFPKVDLTAFNAIHEELAQIFDPTGEHARAMEADGRRGRSKHSRRLSYIAIINRAGYGVADLLDPLRDKSQKSEAGDIVNNFISYKPASCKWHHTTWTNSTVREKFEWCTGVKAAMRQVETTSVALFVYVMANRKRRSQFWDPDEIGVDELGFFGEKWRNIKEVASWKFVQDTLLGPIYNVCRFLGKLGLKPFDKAAKGMRPVMKASRIKEEKYADFCASKSKFQRFIRGILDLRPILNDLWKLIREPLKATLVKGTCRQYNFLARSYESSKFDSSFFAQCDKTCEELKVLWPQIYPHYPLPPLPCTDSTAAPTTAPTLQPTMTPTLAPTTLAPTSQPTSAPVAPTRRELVSTPQQHRELTTSRFNFTAAAEVIYGRYMVDIDDVVELLAKFHDWDEALLEAWKDSGIEAGLEVLYEAIDVYDNLWKTITDIFQASLGDILEFAKSIIDKLGEFICESADSFSNEVTSPPADCGIFGQVINFIRATVNLILGPIEGAIDYLIDLIMNLIIDGIPELRSLFAPFDFDFYWDDLINQHIAAVNQSMVEMFDKFSNTFSIDRLSPTKDMAKFIDSIIDPALTVTSQEIYERFPVLSFSCASGFIPIVLTFEYTADNCNLDLGPSFRFPCPGATTSTCTRTDIEQYVRSCYSTIPVDPPDFLPANYTLYTTNLNYICWNRAQNLSVLGELIRYPGSGTLNDHSSRLLAGPTLRGGQYAATYPDNLTAGFDTVIYVEHATLLNDICFSKAWQDTINPAVDFHYKWWLCYFLQKYGKGSITDTTTGSALGSPSTPMGKINAMKALLAANYTDYNTCQFVPVTTNSGAFVASYTGAPNQIDCSGTYFPNYAAPATLHTSCQAIFENGTAGAGKGYWDTRITQVIYRCTYSGGTVGRYVDGDERTSKITGYINENGIANKWNDCYADLTANYCYDRCKFGFGECCTGEDDAIGDEAGDLIDCYTYVSDYPACISKEISGYSECTLYSDLIDGYRTEVDKKFDTLKTWLNARRSCAAALNNCTGKTTCDLTNCKPEKFEFAYTNQLQPVFPNTAVRFAFYGGLKQQASTSYEERLNCSRHDMRPQLVSLEASWDVFTSYGFNVSTDAPLAPASGSSSAYYSINPTQLRNSVPGLAALSSTLPITFRAEYKCLCPPGYELEPRTFDNVSSCTACANGQYRTMNMPACEPCPVGTYEDGTHTQCRPCPAGTYNNVTAQYANSTAGIVGCQACPVMQVSAPGASYCFDCWQKDPRTNAFYPNGGGPNTWAAANGTVCLACPDHLFTNMSAVNATSQGCIRCPQGYYRFSNMTDCKRAPPGMHMDDRGDAAGITRRLLFEDSAFTQASLRKRSLMYLAHNMRRYLQNQSANDTSPDRSFPTPAELLPCMPGTYNPSFASTTCLACPRGSYQSMAGQSRCDPCRVGFTTREMGSLNVSACVPIIPDDFDYPANMTCDELLTTYASIDDKVLIGDGLCNRGPLNTPNCGYDGGDCCVQTCVSGGKVPMRQPEELYNLTEILKWTNDTEYTNFDNYKTPIPGVEEFYVYYQYSCSPFTFDCRDPAVLNQPLNCSAPKPLTPEVETYLNASCGNYELDPAYGDGFCDERLNFFECGYDGGDCCQQTCRLNRFNGKSCAPSTFNCRDPRSNLTTAAYVNPPLVYKECYPFFYDNGFRDLRVQTAVTTNPDPCAQRDTALEQLADTYLPRPLACPGNMTLTRTWRITDLTTSESGNQTQTVHIATTTPPNYARRPVALWRNASTPARPFYFSKLQTSPFFGFGEADLCTVTVTVAFVSCHNMATGGGSSATCTYDAATDELSLSALEDQDLWEVTVAITDACGNVNTVSTTVAVLVSTEAALPSEVTINNASYAVTEASPWLHAVVSARLPQADNRLPAPTAQVCTEAMLYTTPAPPQLPREEMLAPYQEPPGMQVCLAVTQTPAQCAESATSGRLRTVFLDTAGALGVADAADVQTVDASIAIAGRCEGAGLTSCGDYALDYAALSTPPRPFNLALLINDTAWQGAGNADLGCFYLRAFNLTRPVGDVDLAVVYSDVNGAGLASVGLNQVGTATPPSLNPPNPEQGVISDKVMPPPPGHTRSGLACIAVEPRVVDASTTAICLRATTQYPGCASSAASGYLETIYMDPTAIGLPDPFMYTFESGHDNMMVERPYCVRADGMTPLNCAPRVLDPPQVGGRDLLVGIPVDSSLARWSSADQHIGCLYVTYPDMYAALATGRRSLAAASYNSWPLGFGAQTSDGPAFMAGMLFTDPPDPNGAGAPLGTGCPRNVVMVRVPQGDDEGTTTQVCTTVEVQQLDASTLEVRLSVNDTLPQCVSSSTQGRLRALFFDTMAFGQLPPMHLSFQDGTIRIDPDVCTEVSPASPVNHIVECNGNSVWGLPSGGTNSTYFNVGLTVANPNDAAWSNTRNAVVGIFYVKSFNGIALTPPAEGWSVGLVYSDTDGRSEHGPNRAVSAARLCTRSPQTPTQPCGPAEKRIVMSSWKGDLPMRSDPDRAYTKPKRVCTDVKITRIDARTLQVCLATTSKPLQCRASATSGRLAGVFFSSKPFGVGDAWELNVENGTIAFQTPYCTTRKRGFGKKLPRVDRCGSPQAANSLRLGAHNKHDFHLDVGLTVASDVAWSGTADAALGCFFISGPANQPDFAKKTKKDSAGFGARKYKRKWNVGLRYQDVGKQKTTEWSGSKKSYAIMLGSVCLEDGSGM